MTRMEKLISALSEDDLEKVKKFIEEYPDDVPENPEKAVDFLIHNILWDYKAREAAAPVGKGYEIERKKAEIYSKWKKLGIIK